MVQEYLRESRPYFHVGKSHGLSESNAYQTIEWVEDTLIEDGTFSLPGRKALLESDMEYEMVRVDVTETPVQTPGIQGLPSFTPILCCRRRKARKNR